MVRMTRCETLQRRARTATRSYSDALVQRRARTRRVDSEHASAARQRPSEDATDPSIHSYLTVKMGGNTAKSANESAQFALSELGGDLPSVIVLQ